MKAMSMWCLLCAYQALINFETDFRNIQYGHHAKATLYSQYFLISTISNTSMVIGCNIYQRHFYVDFGNSDGCVCVCARTCGWWWCACTHTRKHTKTCPRTSCPASLTSFLKNTVLWSKILSHNSGMKMIVTAYLHIVNTQL
jgi:hypothetical protein